MKPMTIWIGTWRVRRKNGRRTVYAATAASTRRRCLELIEQGPFWNAEPQRYHLTPARNKR